MHNNLLSSEIKIIETSIYASTEILNKSHFIEQLGSLRVLKREYTGVGFFTDFTVMGADMYMIYGCNLMIGVSADLKGIKYGADFIVYIKNGLICSLEGVCFAEKWPEEFMIDKIWK